MTIFVVCALVTISALFYLFYLPGKLHVGPEKTRLAYLEERKQAVYENLRDLNFEYKAGKLPDSDYQSLKSSLEEEAAALLAEIANLEQTASSIPSMLPGGSGKKGARV
jgi:outer membrane protein TolC